LSHSLGGKVKKVTFYARIKTRDKYDEYNQIVIQNFRTEIHIFNSVMLHQMYDCDFLRVMLRGLFK